MNSFPASVPERFSRQLPALAALHQQSGLGPNPHAGRQTGVDAQQALGQARVAVVGAGGLGSGVLPYLAAAGVGTLGIADADEVEESNLARQVLYGPAQVGLAKSAQARRRVADLAPDCAVVDLGWIDETTGRDQLSGFDLVVDGTDSFVAKLLLSRLTTDLDIPHVWASVVGWNLQVCVFWARAGVTLRDLYPQAPPDPTLSATRDGIMGPTCAVAGGVMGAEALKLLTAPASACVGKLLVADLARGRWQTIELRPAQSTETAAEETSDV